ncbi:MAG: PKD domain-containing protein [Bacteroidota bacterium]
MKNKILYSLATLLLLAFSNSLFAQIGSTCATPHVIPSLNFVQTGLSTSGTGNNYDQNDACLSNYMTGNDYVFEYSPVANEVINISLTNTGNLVGLFLIKRCPDDPLATCVANATSAIGNPSIINASLMMDSTYYIVVSTLSVLGQNVSTNFDITVNHVEAYDAGVTAFVAPVSDCGLGLTENVTITITNFGAFEISNFNVSYKVGNNAAVTEPFIDTIPYRGSMNFTFATSVDLSSVGSTYSFKAYPTLTGDNVVTNDTSYTSATNNTFVSSFPYYENFESGSNGWIAAGTNSSWQLGTPSATIINTAFSGTNAWKTNLSGNANTGENSWVISPCFDFSTLLRPVLKLAIQYENLQILDYGFVETSVDDGLTWALLGAQGEPNNWYNIAQGWNASSGQWLIAEHAMQNLAGEPSVKIRIRYNGNAFQAREGIAFDDIRIFEYPAKDIGIVSIDAPVSSCGMGSETISVRLSNYGTQPQSGFPLYYSVNGNTPVSGTFASTINPGDTLLYNFSTQANFTTPGVFNIEAYTELSGDTVLTNDTAIISVVSIATITTFPYNQSFDVANDGWSTGGTSSSWALGTPSCAVINAPASSPNSWKTNLTGNHNNGENSWVMSPCLNFGSLVNPAIEMDVFYKTSLLASVTLEASIDGGNSWFTIGASGDSTNWYNGLLGGWNGNSASWTTAKHILDSTAGQSDVRLRVLFNGGFIGTDEGFAFDNIHIYDCTPAIASFTTSQTGTVVNFTNSSSGSTSCLWNFGDGMTSTTNSPAHTYAANGQYHATLIVFNDCDMDSTSIDITVNVGIDEADALPNVVLFPNPAGDFLNVNFNSSTPSFTLTIESLQGSILKQFAFASRPNTSSESIDISYLAKGAYIIKIASEKGINTQLILHE